MPVRIMSGNGLCGLVLAAFVALAVSGCSDARQEMASGNNLKELSCAIIKYHADNKSWPDSLGDVKPLIGKEGPLGVIGKGKDFAALTTNPLTGDNPGYEYVKPPADVKSSAATIVLYQLRGGKRDATLPVAFLDGSVRLANRAPQ